MTAATRLAVLGAALAGCYGAGPPLPVPEEWVPLVEAEWTLAPGEEAFVCALRTVEDDVLIQGIRAEAPPGTHHTVVTVAEATGPDGTFVCDPGVMSDQMIYASGPGTDELALPPGVALRVPAGKQVLLNLHLANPYDEPLSGTSGTWIRTLDEAALEAEAEVVFAGPTDFALPPSSASSASGGCVFTEDATIVALWPHMHRFGQHMTVVHEGETVLHDAPFAFEAQPQVPLAPTWVRAGERVDVTCTWTNTSPEPVLYGDTSEDEMCFAALYRYPASGGGLYCLPPPG